MFKSKQDQDKHSHILSNINSKRLYFGDTESAVVTPDTLEETLRRMYDLYRLGDGELQMMIHRGELTVEDYLEDIRGNLSWNFSDTAKLLKKAAIVNSNLPKNVKALMFNDEGDWVL